MTDNYLKLLLPLLLCTAGCVTGTHVARLEPVGPDPALTAQNSGPGTLRVYSARERVPIDVNAEEFFWNNDYGRNEFLHYPAHTGYVLYDSDGRRVQRVSNGTDMNNASPTTVELPPGLYQVEAEAEDYDAVTLTVRVPVRIEPGLTTTVHLDGKWNPAFSLKPSDKLVYLPHGQVVGWHSPRPMT